jgi:hypothetical protein
MEVAAPQRAAIGGSVDVQGLRQALMAVLDVLRPGKP